MVIKDRKPNCLRYGNRTIGGVGETVFTRVGISIFENHCHDIICRNARRLQHITENSETLRYQVDSFDFNGGKYDFVEYSIAGTTENSEGFLATSLVCSKEYSYAAGVHRPQQEKYVRCDFIYDYGDMSGQFAHN